MDLGVPDVTVLLAISLVAKKELLVDIRFISLCLFSILELSCTDCKRIKFSNTISNHGI